MNEASPDLLLFDEFHPTAEKGTLVVHIPAKLPDKRAILAEYDRQLQFPWYFGWNWDAFLDCLSSLHWLDDSIQRVVVVHQDVPFPHDPDLRETYMSCLGHHDEWFKESPNLDKLTVEFIFPLSTQRYV